MLCSKTLFPPYFIYVIRGHFSATKRYDDTVSSHNVFRHVIRAMEENQDRTWPWWRFNHESYSLWIKIYHLKHREFRCLLSAWVAYVWDRVPLLNTQIFDKQWRCISIFYSQGNKFIVPSEMFQAIYINAILTDASSASSSGPGAYAPDAPQPMRLIVRKLSLVYGKAEIARKKLP